MNYLTHQLLNAEEINFIKKELEKGNQCWEAFCKDFEEINAGRLLVRIPQINQGWAGFSKDS